MFIYLAASCLSCDMQDLSVWCTGSVDVMHRLVGCSMWDSSFPTRDQTPAPCVARQILNHWTTREVPSLFNY